MRRFGARSGLWFSYSELGLKVVLKNHIELKSNLMKSIESLMALCLAGLLSACGTDGFFGRAEGSCVKYPTPEARAECEKRHRQAFSDFNKQQEQDRKAQREAEKVAPEKPSGLCFKRQPSGELVCPN